MSNATGTGLRRPDSSPRRSQRAGQRALVALELTTGAAALAGGVMLMAVPDGSLLHADPNVLAGTPFPDWRVPGLLLAALVGGGFLLTGWWQLADHKYARQLSIIAGTGLIIFEAAELAWIGFQPLEAVFALVGVAVIGLAWHRHGIQVMPQARGVHRTRPGASAGRRARYFHRPGEAGLTGTLRSADITRMR
jgi:hypothetical protein